MIFSTLHFFIKPYREEYSQIAVVQAYLSLKNYSERGWRETKQNFQQKIFVVFYEMVRRTTTIFTLSS